MRLRNRQLGDLNHFFTTMANTPPPNTPPPNAHNTVLHAITQHSPNIVKFAGRINGKCDDIDTFLESLDAHLDATNITDPSQRLKEARSYLDLSKGGDISSFTAGWNFRSLQTYEQFKSYLRNIYGRVTSSDTVKSLSKIFRNAALSDKDYISFAGELYNELNSFKLRAQTNPEWFPNGQIPIDNLCSLIHMSLVLAHLPKPLTESFKEPLKKTNDIVTIQHLVRENQYKIVNLDQSRLDNHSIVNPRLIASVHSHSPSRTSHSQSPHRTSNSPHRTSNSPHRTSHRTFHSPTRTPNFTNSVQTCRYCPKTNHYESQCFQNPIYCGLHKTKSHSAVDCYTLKNRFNRGRSRLRQTPQQRHNNSNYHSYPPNSQFENRKRSNSVNYRKPRSYRSDSYSPSGSQNFRSPPQTIQNT